MKAYKDPGVALLALMLAGCITRPSPLAAPTANAVPNTVTNTVPNTVADAAAPRLQPVVTLVGEWRVAGIDDRPVEGPLGLALSADAREIWWEPRCAGLVRSYRIDGQRFSTAPQLGLAVRQPGDPAPPVCAIGPPPQIREVMRSLDSGRTIVRTPANGIRIAGGGNSLLLFSQ